MNDGMKTYLNDLSIAELGEMINESFKILAAKLRTEKPAFSEAMQKIRVMGEIDTDYSSICCVMYPCFSTDQTHKL